MAKTRKLNIAKPTSLDTAGGAAAPTKRGAARVDELAAKVAADRKAAQERSAAIQQPGTYEAAE